MALAPLLTWGYHHLANQRAYVLPGFPIGLRLDQCFRESDHLGAIMLNVIGESVSEMLDWVPAQLRVIRTTRPKYACRSCETVVQAPAPERVITGGLATSALLAKVLVSKYCDHTPLYRHSQIFAVSRRRDVRSGLDVWFPLQGSR